MAQWMHPSHPPSGTCSAIPLRALHQEGSAGALGLAILPLLHELNQALTPVRLPERTCESEESVCLSLPAVAAWGQRIQYLSLELLLPLSHKFCGSLTVQQVWLWGLALGSGSGVWLWGRALGSFPCPGSAWGPTRRAWCRAMEETQPAPRPAPAPMGQGTCSPHPNPPAAEPGTHGRRPAGPATPGPPPPSSSGPAGGTRRRPWGALPPAARNRRPGSSVR